jgi:MFS family permease
MRRTHQGGALEGRRGTIRSALAHRDFRLLLVAQTISQTGDWLYSISLIVYVLERTGSGAWVAATTIVRFLPYVLLGPLGGVIADHFDRKRVMIATDLARGATMVILGIAAAADAPAIVAIGLATLAVVLAVPYQPSVYASTPALVGEEDLTAANAVNSVVASVTLAVGPAIGGLILAIASPSEAFVVNGATFFVSALLTMGLRTRLKTEIETEVGTEGKEASFTDRLKEGFATIVSSRDIVLIVLVALTFMIFYGQQIVLYALAATERLGLGEEGIGYMFAAIGVGGVLAAGLTSKLSDRSRQAVILVAATILTAIPMLALTVVRSSGLAYALLLLQGVGFIVGDIVATTMLQRLLPANVLGRVFGILDSLMVSGILLGSVLAPAVVEAGGLDVGLIVGAGLMIAAGVALLPGAREIDRRTAEKFAQIEPRVELLESVELFEAANRQTLESLVGAAHEEHVTAGTVVIREGDEPDDLYVVVSGRLEVHSAGEIRGEAQRLGELGAGDYFGEIGLLERIPRTATVTALEDSTLLRISGEEFLRAANEGPGVSGTVRAALTGRLARTHPSRLITAT